jgi:hypothetical protein
VVAAAIIKIVYKPVSIVGSVIGRILAGVIFKRIWKAAAGEDEAPQATGAQRSWREVLVAATLQGATFWSRRPWTGPSRRAHAS